MKKTIAALFASLALCTASAAYADNVIVDEIDSVSDTDKQQLKLAVETAFPEAVFTPTTMEEDTKIQVVSVNNPDALVSFLKHNALIQHVEKQQVYTASYIPNDPLYDSKQWDMKNIGMETGWGYATGQGVTVAVIDTGVSCKTLSDLNHSKCTEGFNFVENSDNAEDDHGHGSHVAGTIAQVTNNNIGLAGMAANANIMPIKVLSQSGSGTTEDIADGIRWSADHGAQIINMSLGGGGRSAVLEDAIIYARSKGVVIIAAAGNDKGPVNYPAAYDGVIGVSAMNENNSLANFSSRGAEIDITAPGTNITQQTICKDASPGCEQYATWNGTSMASPHVAGAAALLMSMGVTDPNEVEAYLKYYARKDGELGKNAKFYGAGGLSVGPMLSSVSFRQGVLRLALLLAWVYIMQQIANGKNTLAYKNWKFLVPASLMGVGMFFLPMVFSNPVVGMLARPLAETDLLVSANLHKWLLTASALVPMGLTVLGWHKPLYRYLVAGIASGSGIYTASLLFKGIHFNPFGWYFSLFMIANIALCGAIAHLNMCKTEEANRE